MDAQRWQIITEKVIELLEGGYFHPFMLNDSRRVTGMEVYTKSGETMFGLDRHAGHSLFYTNPRKSADVKTNLQYIPLYTYKNETAKQFWQTIDQADAANSWQWNYKGGSLNRKLTALAAEIMLAEYNRLSKIYLLPTARKIIDDSPELTFNFAYATWNGSGFFQYYANKVNQAIISGEQNPNALNKIILDARSASQYATIRRSADKMKAYFESSFFADLKKRFLNVNTGLAALAAVFFLYVTYKIIKQ